MPYMEKGEDGVIQTFFEFLKVPYTYSGIISSFNSNKILSKNFIKNKILTPKYFLLNKSNFCKRNLKKLIKKIKLVILLFQNQLTRDQVLVLKFV